MKRIFSGIQPSGVVHIGNYLGAIKQFVELQNQDAECIYCIVDLHTITVPQDPEALKKNILSVAAIYLACGVDPEKSTIFVQSHRPEVAELSWILNCHTYMGELERMAQFKEKAGENRKSVSAGLFDYPVLMAADILLYRTTDVPVGEDQKQHIEITRDIAERINNKYGQVFTVPNPLIKKETARIMGLDDPKKKMAKSASTAFNYIALTDEPDVIRDKIKRAVTDSGSEIKAASDKPAISNLLTIFSGISGKSIAELEQEFEGKNYSEFKSDLAEAVVRFLTPIQKKYNELMSEPEKLREILNAGAKKLEPIAKKTLIEVKSKIGLG
ncbi:MAG: tryptophan--tRNA ligase [Candidatus Berkelbacteria bacterium]|nr:tryptophan--tRNA ligase [Candidatus Berkelbacteria bacterium]